jgi:DNA-binding response OmpR family regulator
VKKPWQDLRSDDPGYPEGMADAAEPGLRALVVEDERHIRELVALHLELDGWKAVTVGDGEAALKLAREQPFDLVVLDLMLPGLDGLTVLRALRRDGLGADVPVLLLTARREESDKVLGLETGADDYLTKPFGVRELVARARALTRRSRHSQRTDGPPVDAGRVARLGNVTIDPARRRVTVGDEAVELTGREFDLLYLLATHPGIVFSREALLARVWKGETFVTERNVDTLVKRIRRKIERDPAEPTLVLTVWGTGYKAADV